MSRTISISSKPPVMITPIPREIIVLVDSREKYPITFPANIRYATSPRDSAVITIKTKTATLKTGDYSVAKHEHWVAVERKASLDELYNNLCTDDVGRFLRSIERLMAIEFPLLILDLSPHELLTPTRLVDQPYFVVDRLMKLVTRYRIPMWFAGQSRTSKSRMSLGEELVRYMLATILYGGGSNGL